MKNTYQTFPLGESRFCVKIRRLFNFSHGERPPQRNCNWPHQNASQLSSVASSSNFLTEKSMFTKSPLQEMPMENTFFIDHSTFQGLLSKSPRKRKTKKSGSHSNHEKAANPPQCIDEAAFSHSKTQGNHAILKKC
jgi:hypothetical protein